MSVADEIEKLYKLNQDGIISEEEYEQKKKALLDKPESVGGNISKAMDGISSDENMWAMFIHLSQFCSFILPLSGLIVPIVLWQVKKNESAVIDKHGRIVANWIATAFIFGIVFSLLAFIVIGIPLLFALAVVGIVFPIIGGVKANNGEVWPYPLSIKFFDINDVPQDGRD